MEPEDDNTFFEKRPELQKLPYGVPEGYFESLAERIESQVKMKALDVKLPFTTPDDYFETLSKQIENKIAVPETRVIKWKLTRWNYAAAAAASIILVLGIYFANPVKKTLPVTGNYYTEGISTSEITRQLEQSDIDEALLLKEIDPATLVASKRDQIQLDEKEMNKILEETDINEITTDL
jgi:hypothetical protein